MTGQYAVVNMSDGVPRVVRIVDVYPPNEQKDFCGHPHTAPYECVYLEGLALVPSDSVTIVETEIEAKLLLSGLMLAKTERALELEKAYHARTRKKLYAIKHLVRSA